MKRWLVVAGLLVACIPDMALATSRTPSLFQRILSALTPRPAPHHYVSHTGTQKVEAPVMSAQTARPLPTPVPVAAPRPVETAQPVQAAQALEPAPAPTRPESVSKSVRTAQTIKAKAAKATPAAPPVQVAQPVPVPKAQPVRAEPRIETAQPVPVAATETPSKPDPAAQATKKAKSARAAKPVEVAILGMPNLKAALPAETATPLEIPRQSSEPRVPPARQETNSGCNGGRRVVSAYYWEGSHTASGQPFNPHALTAAHRTLPFGTRLNVTNPRTGKTVSVLINDRGPFVRGVSLDLSLGAAQAIGLHGTGSVCIL